MSDGRYRIERSDGNVYFDGKAGWIVRPDGSQAFKDPAPLPSPLMNAISPQWLRHPGVALVDLGESVIDGRPCLLVEARTSDGEEHHSLTVDQATGLILKGRDERTGSEFELHDVVLGQVIDESLFRPDLGPGVTVIQPPSRARSLGMLAKFAVRSAFRRRP